MQYLDLSQPPADFDEQIWEPLVANSTRGFGERTVIVRSDGLKMSQAFVEQAKIHDAGKTHALIDMQPRRFLLRLQFITQTQLEELRRERGPIENAFKLHHDGGSGNTVVNRKRGSIIQNKAALKKEPWLDSASAKDFDLRRRFEPQPTAYSFVWTTQIVPGFLNASKLDDAKPSPGDKGVYAITVGDECVYFGSGALADRFRKHNEAPELRDACVRWTVYPHEATMRFAERHFLHAYRAKFGRLPKYNKMAGPLSAPTI